MGSFVGISMGTSRHGMIDQCAKLPLTTHRMETDLCTLRAATTGLLIQQLQTTRYRSLVRLLEFASASS